MPDLKTLISERRDRGESYRQMANRASEAGYRIKFQTIGELATTLPRGWPKRAETIRALAAALEVSERAVVLAYAESLGVDVGQPASFVDMLPAAVDGLDPDMRDALLRVIRVAARRSDVSRAQEPGAQEGGAKLEEPTPIGGRRQFRPAPKPSAMAARTPKKGRKGEAYDPVSGEYVGGDE